MSIIKKSFIGLMGVLTLLAFSPAVFAADDGILANRWNRDWDWNDGSRIVIRSWNNWDRCDNDRWDRCDRWNRWDRCDRRDRCDRCDRWNRWDRCDRRDRCDRCR